MNNKIVVYTCITNGYDNLKQIPFGQNPNVDFVCFSDKEPDFTKGWIIKPIPEDLKYIPQKKIQRIIKICPHRYLKEYDISLWIDGNIQILNDAYNFIKKYDLEKFYFYSRKHPSRNCLYDEAEAVIKKGFDSYKNVLEQINRYKEEDFPEHIGLFETNVILRKHNDLRCVRLDNMWATEVLNGSHRDQLSFSYCLWKMKGKVSYFDVDLKNGKEFKWVPHAK